MPAIFLFLDEKMKKAELRKEQINKLKEFANTKEKESTGTLSGGEAARLKIASC